jgi:hypothetical protein
MGMFRPVAGQLYLYHVTKITVQQRIYVCGAYVGCCSTLGEFQIAISAKLNAIRVQTQLLHRVGSVIPRSMDRGHVYRSEL